MANRAEYTSPSFVGDPVWKRQVTFTIEAGGGHDEITFPVQINGILQEAIIEVGAVEGISGNANVDFDDDEGVEFSATAALVEGSKTILAFSKPIAGIFKVRVDVNDDPTAGQDDWKIVVTCRGI